MNNSQWFSQHLRASADGFIWGAQQIPVERHYLSPPAVMGEWSAARHVFHMVYYEETFALPSMRLWLDGAGLTGEELEEIDEAAAWNEGYEFDVLQKQFREVRERQIALITELSEELWLEKRRTVWGLATLHWVVSKTYQHTADHANTVLRMALFWDLV